MIVRNATTVAGVTSKPEERVGTDGQHDVVCHSNQRADRHLPLESGTTGTARSARRTPRAPCRALPATSSPKDGLTCRVDRLSTSTPTASASVAATSTAAVSGASTPRTRKMSSAPVTMTSCTRASGTPPASAGCGSDVVGRHTVAGCAAGSGVRAAPSVFWAPAGTGISHTEPPSNSMPRVQDPARAMPPRR